MSRSVNIRTSLFLLASPVAISGINLFLILAAAAVVAAPAVAIVLLAQSRLDETLKTIFIFIFIASVVLTVSAVFGPDLSGGVHDQRQPLSLTASDPAAGSIAN